MFGGDYGRGKRKIFRLPQESWWHFQRKIRVNYAKKYKEEAADALKEVFNLDLPEDIAKRFARLGIFADKSRKTY